MRQTDGRIVLSATDLGRDLACRHLTQLDRAAAQGRLKAPHWEDPTLDALRERGMQHEKAYEDHLRAEGLSVVRVEDRNDADAVSVLMR